MPKKKKIKAKKQLKKRLVKRKPAKTKAVKKKKKKVGGTKSVLAPSIKSHDLLSEGLRDIEFELLRLRQEKLGAEKELKRLMESIEDTQEMELELKNKISKFQNKEEQLNLKKKQVTNKITTVKKKIEKVTKIGTEMEGI